MDVRKLSRQLNIEVDAAFLYQRLSDLQTDANLKQVLASMAEIEKKHAQRVLDKLLALKTNATMPAPSIKARIQLKLGRIFGYRSILNTLCNIEKQYALNSIHQKKLKGEKISGSEHNHLKIIQALNNNIHITPGLLTKFENRHRSVDGNALRAAVLGANDGLVSNMSLVMGVAGAAVSNSTILLTGVAGLLAGAISMALGEWLSVQSARELHDHQVKQEMAELESSPEEEKQELILLYQAKGLDTETARKLTEKKFSTPESAIKALMTEELGVEPEDLNNSAWEAAIASFSLFSIGAIIPVLPYFFVTGDQAIIASIIFSTIGLFTIGAATTLFTGRTVLFAGVRQIIFGLGAAAVTYIIGHIIGVSLLG